VRPCQFNGAQAGRVAEIVRVAFLVWQLASGLAHGQPITLSTLILTVYISFNILYSDLEILLTRLPNANIVLNDEGILHASARISNCPLRRKRRAGLAPLTSLRRFARGLESEPCISGNLQHRQAADGGCGQSIVASVKATFTAHHLSNVGHRTRYSLVLHLNR
jgi:hypothetical protein